MEKEIPTECSDCKCTNLVSDQCKGECLCHHPELTPTEEWEREAYVEIRDHLALFPQMPFSRFTDILFRKIRTLLSSHDAELARKIEGTLLTILVRSGDRKTLDEYIRRDAVLALLGKKNV